MSLAISESFEVVRLTPANAAQLLELNALFADVFEDPDTYLGAPAGLDYLQALLAKEHVVALVGVAGGAVIGGLVGYELDKFERVRREIYIYDLAVTQSWRRHGVATALIREVQAIASARGAWAVYVQADYEDEPAVALYSKLGVREDVIHFDLPVARAS